MHVIGPGSTIPGLNGELALRNMWHRRGEGVDRFPKELENHIFKATIIVDLRYLLRGRSHIEGRSQVVMIR